MPSLPQMQHEIDCSRARGRENTRNVASLDERLSALEKLVRVPGIAEALFQADYAKMRECLHSYDALLHKHLPVEAHALFTRRQDALAAQLGEANRLLKRGNGEAARSALDALPNLYHQDLEELCDAIDKHRYTVLLGKRGDSGYGAGRLTRDEHCELEALSRKFHPSVHSWH